MRKARPDIDIFFDVDSLRSGDDWEQALWREIDKRDVLFLCWSEYARESKWVDAEWRYAYKSKGPEYIEPVPSIHRVMSAAGRISEKSILTITCYIS